MKKPARKLKFKELLGYWLRHFKPIHLCWWFEKHGWKVPKYFVGTSSNYDLTHYIFATDSGTTDPDTQTFGTEDDPVSEQAKETPFFIRFQIRETGGKAGTNSYWQLYYNTTNNPAGASQVTTTGDGTVKIVDDPGSNITNFAATDTRIMSEYTGETFISGEYVDNADDTNSKYQLDSSTTLGYIEFMWCVQFESGASDGQNYYFYPRCLDTVMDSHSVHPQITTAVGNVNVNQYDDNLSVSDEVVVAITPYLINQADENPEVTDESQQYITPYLVNQYDDNLSIEDFSNQVIAQWVINQADDITVSDECNVAINYAVNVHDDIFIDKMKIIGSVYNVNLNGFGWIAFDLTRDVAYGTALTGDTFTSFDISDPENPTVLDQLTTVDEPLLNGCEGIAIEGMVAYVGAETSNSVISIDISNPSSLSILDSVTDNTYLNMPECVRVYGDYLLVACYGGHSITPIDKTNPSSMVVKTSWMLQDATYLPTPVMINIKSDGSGGTVTNWTGTYFTSFDLSSGVDNMSVLHNVNHANLNSMGGHAYFADETRAVVCSRGTDNVVIINIENLSSMSYVTSYLDADVLEAPYVPVVLGNYVAITGYDNDAVAILDLTNPSSPSYIDHIEDGTYLDGVDDIHFNPYDTYLHIGCNVGRRYTILDAPVIGSVKVEIPVLVINAYDNITTTEDEIVEITALTDIDINQYDDITVTDETELYLSVYEIYAYDDVTVTDEENVSIPTAANGWAIGASQIDGWDIGASQLYSTEAAADVDVNVNDGITVEDETSQYLSLFEIYVYDDSSLEDVISLFLTFYEIYAYDDLSLEDYGETALIGEGILSINEYDSLTLTDEPQQYLSKYVVSTFDDLNIEDTSSQYLTIYEINVSDELSLQEDSTVETVGAGIISIEQYDELSLIDSSAQYLSLYEIYAYDGLTSEDSVSLYLSSYIISVYDSLTVQESAALELSYYEISVSDDLTVQDESDVLTTSADILYIYEYDGLNIQDSQDTQLTPYLIATSDNLTVEDSDVTNLNFYIVYQSEDISLEDYTNVNEVGIGTRNIEVYDDLALTDYIEKYLSLYEINENDSIEMQDSTSSTLDLYLISESDSLAVSDSPTARLTPYLISEYEPITVQEYSNQIVALKTRMAIGTDFIELSDYADVSFAVYPFLYAILRARSTESSLEIEKSKTELMVSN